MPDTAPSQCPSCSGVERHTTICPESLKVWPAHGDEVCSRCTQPIVGHYTHAEHAPGVEVVGEPDEVICLGCGAHAAIGATS